MELLSKIEAVLIFFSVPSHTLKNKSIKCSATVCSEVSSNIIGLWENC